MSKIKLTGHASGSGVLTIAAPNTDTDRTITLPDVTGTLLDSGSDLPAANLTGTVADARISTLTASKLTGDLPAISGANLTGISAGTTLTGSTNNQVTTVTGANAIAGEAKLQFVPDGESKLQIGNGTAEDAFIKIHGNSQNLYWGLDDSVDTITLGWGSTVGSNIIQTIETDNRSVHYGHFHLGTKNLAPWNASGNTTPCTFWDDIVDNNG